MLLPYKIFATPAPYDKAETLYNDEMAERAKLPSDEVDFLSRLEGAAFESRIRALWKSGWSLSEIGDSLSPKRTKTTIHFWVNKASDSEQIRIVPEPPPRSLTTSVPTKTAPRLRPISPGVPEGMRSRLKELSELARLYRSRTPYTSPFAQANEELTAVAKTLKSMGVPTAAIAEAAGVSYRAMARRVSK